MDAFRVPNLDAFGAVARERAALGAVVRTPVHKTAITKQGLSEGVLLQRGVLGALLRKHAGYGGNGVVPISTLEDAQCVRGALGTLRVSSTVLVLWRSTPRARLPAYMHTNKRGWPHAHAQSAHAVLRVHVRTLAPYKPRVHLTAAEVTVCPRPAPATLPPQVLRPSRPRHAAPDVPSHL